MCGLILFGIVLGVAVYGYWFFGMLFWSAIGAFLFYLFGAIIAEAIDDIFGTNGERHEMKYFSIHRDILLRNIENNVIPQSERDRYIKIAEEYEIKRKEIELTIKRRREKYFFWKKKTRHGKKEEGQ